LRNGLKRQALLLLGQGFGWLELRLIPEYRGFLLMALPPGGFLMLGFILAGKKILDKRLAERLSVSEINQERFT
jgi:electron transport complex protein RnfE